LNAFPPKSGISKEYSPRIIMGKRPIDYNKHCKISFGSYVQASNENVPTNTMKPRTIGAIYLQPTDNVQGGHQLLNLSTGRVITRAHVTEIPIPQDVVDRVEFLAQQDNVKPDLQFKTQRGELIPDYDDDLIAGVEDEPPQPPQPQQPHQQQQEDYDDNINDEYNRNDEDRSTSITDQESISDEELFDIHNESDETTGVADQEDPLPQQ